MRLRFILISLLYISISKLLIGQDQYVIEGNVLDSHEKPLVYGDVFVMKPEFDQVIKYANVDSGYFKLDPLPQGQYKIIISCLGYNDYLDTVSLVEHLTLKVTLSEQVQNLDEVTVTATKNPIVAKGGNLEVQVKNSIFENQASTIDLFAMLPKVLVDPNGESISIIGKGSPLLYMENQRISMDRLLALPISEIEKIEIINNPSAKYEASGRSVILITRTKNIPDGLEVNIRESASWRRKFNNYFSSDMQLRRNRLEFRANGGYNHLGFWESSRSRYEVTDRDIISNYLGLATGLRPEFLFGGGIYYDLKNGSYISANANARLFTDKFPIVVSSDLSQQGNIDNLNTVSDNDARRKFASTNINFNQKLKNWDGNLFIGAGLSYHLRDLINEIFVSANDMGFDKLQDRDQIYTIGSKALRVDLEKNISSKVKWEIGSSWSQADAKAKANFNYLVEEETFISDYKYDESNFAAYSQLSGNLSKIEFLAGLRLENNSVLGKFRDQLDPAIDRKNNRIFPRLNLSYQLDDDWSLGINYGTTIQRPSYLNASSISTYLDPFLEFERNPNLVPTITEETAFLINYKSQSLTFSLINRKNPVFYSSIYNEESDRLISSPQNFSSSNGYRIEYILPANYKSWNITNTLVLTQNEIIDPSGILSNSKPYLYVYSNHRWKLTEGTYLGLNFWGMTKREEGIFQRNSLFVMNLNFSKVFLKN